MKEKSINRVRLGAFVLVATLLLVLGLYYIGSQQNIFHSTISVISDFKNVGGLMSGNNVRFNGIDVGTVSKVYPVADTAIRVEYTIDESSTQFITKDAIASIATDGLLGNKIINISPGTSGGEEVEEGDYLQVSTPVEMESQMRTLSITNDNLKVITDNLKAITEKFNNDNALWSLLSDTAMVENVRSAVVKFKVTSDHTAVITGDLKQIVSDMKSGKGTVGALLTDTLISHKLNQTIVNIQAISDSVALISGNFKAISDEMKNGNGAFATLISDTTFVHNLNESMENIKSGSANFSDDMEALKHSWPFKKYFRNLEKEKKED